MALDSGKAASPANSGKASFIGIDPSMRGTSLVETDASGSVLQTRRIRFPDLKGLPLLEALDDEFKKFIASLAARNTPTFLAIEDLSLQSIFFRYEQYFVQGVFRLALKRSRLPFIVVSPTRVKSYLSLKRGSMDKESVRIAAQKLYPAVQFALFKDDNDVDAFLLSRMAAIAYSFLVGLDKVTALEVPTLTQKQIEFFYGPLFRGTGRNKSSRIYKGILQRSDFLINWAGENSFGWTDLG